jgi:hypothetical protein
MKKSIRPLISHQRLERDYMLAVLAAFSGGALAHAIYRHNHALPCSEDVIAAITFAAILAICLLLPWVCEKLDRALHRGPEVLAARRILSASFLCGGSPLLLLDSCPKTVKLRRTR